MKEIQNQKAEPKPAEPKTEPKVQPPVEPTPVEPTPVAERPTPWKPQPTTTLKPAGLERPKTAVQQQENTDTDAKKSVGILRKLFGAKADPQETGGLKELPEFLTGVFELVSDGFKTMEDGKVSIKDAFNFLDFRLYAEAFTGLGIMTRIELATATDEQIENAYKAAREKFVLKNKQVETAVEMIVGGILGALRLIAVTREKVGTH